MKRISTKFIAVLFCLTALIPPAQCDSFQESQDPLRTRLSLDCKQTGMGEVLLEVKLKAKQGRIYSEVEGSEITISAISDTNNIVLHKANTNATGDVSITLDINDKLIMDEEGYYNIEAVFEGDNNYSADDDMIQFKPGVLILEAEKIDSVNTISIELKDLSAEKIALEDFDVTVEVPRLFSNLPIATESTDEEGKLEIIFPEDLPGGEDGTLQIIARAEDTDDHATLQSKITVDWGVPVNNIESQKSRELWSPNAPLWMVATFVILMVLVWGHFFVIIYKLYLIRKEGKSLESST